jgi:uncharacterized protein YkwD
MKFLLLLFLMITGCKSPSAENLNPLDNYRNTASQDELTLIEDYFTLMNGHRHNLGINALIYSREIELKAQEHSRNMANGTTAFGHTGSGARCSSIMTAIGPANLCGEIVAKGQNTSLEVFNSWMGSSGHRSKIENARYTHTGVSVIKNDSGVSFWTQIFLEVY